MERAEGVQQSSSELRGELARICTELTDVNLTKELSEEDWKNYAEELAGLFQLLDVRLVRGEELPEVWVIGILAVRNN